MNSGAPAAPRLERRIPVRLLLFGGAAVVAFWLGFLAFGVEQSRVLVKLYGYFTIAGTFAWALFAWSRVCRPATATLSGLARREQLQALGLIAACTAVVLLTTRIDYKILYDEMVLQSTAADMHIYREVSTVVRAYRIDGVFAPLDTYVDKRPFFYPFLVSLVHDVTGYREANAFWLNVALLPLILALVYLLARRIAGHVGGLVATVAIGTLSTLAQSATGAGMETLNLAMLLLVVHFAALYLENPDAPRLAALILATILLAQTRYESSLYVLPVAVVAVEGWRRAGRIIMPVAAVCAPLLLVPYAVHNTYLSGTPSLWELRENAQTRFGLEHLIPNLQHGWNYFFDVHGGLTNSLWLSVAGFAALFFLLFDLLRQRTPWRSLSASGLVVLTFGVAIAANLGVLMFYYWGQLDDPIVARLALPFSAVLAVAIGYAVHRLSGAPSLPVTSVHQPGAAASSAGTSAAWRSHWLGWAAAGGAVLAYLWSGLVANEQLNRRNTLADELAWETQYVEAMPPGERLVVSNKSALPWMLRRVSAISIEYARKHVDKLRTQMDHATFRDLLVTQDYRATSAKGDFQLDPLDVLPDWFVLEPVVEKRFGAHLDRISRLVAIKPGTPPPAPASQPPPNRGKLETARKPGSTKS